MWKGGRAHGFITLLLMPNGINELWRELFYRALFVSISIIGFVAKFYCTGDGVKTREI